MHDWLKRKVAASSLGHWGLSVLSFGGGVLGTLITYYFAFAIMWFSFNQTLDGAARLFGAPHVQLSLRTLFVVDGIFVVLLFWGNARTSREYLADLPEGDWWGRHGAHHHCDNPEPDFKIRTAAKFITDIAYTGPRLITNAWKLVQRARRLRRMDITGCTSLMSVLFSQMHPVPVNTLREFLPHCDVEALAGQLRDINGILSLEAGWVMNPELKAEWMQLVLLGNAQAV